MIVPVVIGLNNIQKYFSVSLCSSLDHLLLLLSSLPKYSSIFYNLPNSGIRTTHPSALPCSCMVTTRSKTSKNSNVIMIEPSHARITAIEEELSGLRVLSELVQELRALLTMVQGLADGVASITADRELGTQDGETWRQPRPRNHAGTNDHANPNPRVNQQPRNNSHHEYHLPPPRDDGYSLPTRLMQMDFP